MMLHPRKFRSFAFSARPVAWLAVFFCLPLLINALTPAGAAYAQVINYPNGFAGSSGQIWLQNGASPLAGSTIQLTTSGVFGAANNAWYETPVNVQAFTTTFTFADTCPTDCGDGLGFMIISTSNPSFPGYTYSGGSGGQLSWSQCGGTGSTVCAAINSILVKFDLYDAQTGSGGANLTGFYSGGTYPQAPNNPQYDMAPSGINMESGDLLRATLTYNGTVLTETVTDTVTGAKYTNSYTANIPALVGGNTAYVGFGGSTGAASASQILSSWTYTVQSPGQAAIPVFSPAAGTYSGSQSVTLATSSAGAVICYNTAGNPATNNIDSCAGGTLYTGPITVPSSETLYAVAGGTGYSDSPVASANYVIQTSVATPTFLPAGGTYTSAQSVSISDTVSGVTIYYTTDGTTPSSSSTRYTGPIMVSTTETLKAVAVSSGGTDSSVGSAAYTVNLLPVVATPIFSPVSGTYSSVQSVTISDATAGATIFYTTNGTTPTTSSTQYTGPIMVNASEKIQAIATATGDNNSTVASANYTISLVPVVAAPTFLPAGGAYTSAQSVTISDATAGATVYYTTDGTNPTASSTVYTGPITVSATETLKAFAVVTGDTASTVVFAAYNIIYAPPAVATPAFSPAGGTYTSAQSVTISDATSGATIYFTTNGTTPTTASTAYTGPIAVSSTETLYAFAVATGDANSAVASATYNIASPLPVVATPVFSPVGGAYTSAQSVSIYDASAGATIYYTTNGTTPTTSSTKYTGPIAVSSTETLEAVAVATGETSSAVASAAYTITASLPSVATPAFSPVAGTYTSTQSVTISDATAGATIYFTTNGNTPTTSSTEYTGPIAVSSTETLEAIAVAPGDSNSAVASAAYTINSVPSFTLGASPGSLTANSSGQATATLTVTPENGFDSPVSFACSGLPTGATCSFSPSTVTPSGTAATTELTISVSAQSSASPPETKPFLPLTALALTVGLFGWRTRRGRRLWLLLAVASVGLGLLCGCGGSSGGGATSPTSTPAPTPTATTSTVTVTATSGTLQGTATVNLTVN